MSRLNDTARDHEQARTFREIHETIRLASKHEAFNRVEVTHVTTDKLLHDDGIAAHRFNATMVTVELPDGRTVTVWANGYVQVCTENGGGTNYRVHDEPRKTELRPWGTVGE